MTDTQTPDSPEPKEAQQGKKVPRHRLRFWLLILLAVVVILPVLLIGALLLALRSETGTAWVIDQISGLEVTQAHGSLLGQWQAESLTWQGFGTGVELREPLISWSPGCLFGKELCLDRLEAQAVDVTLPPSEADDSQPAAISLPTLDIPIALTVGSVDIGPLTVNQSLIWDSFRLGASGSGSAWTVSQLSVERGEIGLDVSGRVNTRGDWPLDLAVKVQLPPPEGDKWLLDLDLTGSVTDLLVRGSSHGYLNAGLSGRTEPLKPALPARLQVQTEKFKATNSLPDTLTLLSTRLTLDGSLADGFKAEGNGQLPGENGKIGLALKGLLTTTGIQKLDLRLSGQGTGNAKTGTASVNGNLSWEEALALEATVLLDAFPWFNLIPGVEVPPVVLNRLSGEVSYQGGSYKAKLEAVVNGPQGRANLASNIEGDLESLQLTNVKVNSGAGFLSGQAQIGFAGPLTWNTTLELSQFNPGYWVPSATASLSGSVTSEGRLQPEGLPAIKATWDLQGSWQTSKALISGKLRQSGESLVLSDLELQVAENHIAGQGSWGPALSGDFRLNVPEPQLFLPQLEGAFKGRVSVSGTPEAPMGTVDLSGENLAWQDQVEIDLLDVTASLSEGETVKGDVTVTGVTGAGQALETLTMSLAGTREDHRLSVRAIHSDADVLVAFAGTAGPDWSTWTGELRKGEINVTSQDQFWRLKQPADLVFDKSGQLTFARHCWMWQEASVCAGQQTLLPELALDYRVRNFPTTALSPLLPETLRWETLLDADLTLNSTGSGREGSLSVDAGDGQFSVLSSEEWETFQYSALTSRVALLPERADLAFELKGPRLGNLSANVSVDPGSKDRNLDGRFRIASLDIALAAVFAGLEEVKGQLNGQGRISGPLRKPAVEGEVTLTGGEISDPALPLPLENIVASVILKGYEAELSGRWQSNDRSFGALGGRASWESEPSVTLQLTGDRLPFQVEPYAKLELTPDLEIAYSAGDLSISGQVGVPRGKIEITELPEQAVSVSEDEEIVGGEPEEASLSSFDMDVTVVVGEDEVSFNGFDVTGNLKGTLRINNDLRTRGSLRLINGRYEAYGQDLELRRARLVFTGPLTEPYLDIEAIRRVGTVIAGIRLSGPVSAPRTEVFSEPSMPQSDALSYLILGRAPRASTRGEEGQMRNAAIALGLNQTGDITRGIGKELGIEELVLETRGSGNEVSVVASGELTEDLSLRYGVGIFEPITTVALRYDLGRYFYLEAASGLAASLDIFYTRDF